MRLMATVNTIEAMMLKRQPVVRTLIATAPALLGPDPSLVDPGATGDEHGLPPSA